MMRTVRGYSPGPRNGMPAGRPYVYRGASPDPESRTAHATGQNSVLARRQRIADFSGYRAAGMSVEEAAGAVGVTAGTARTYESARLVRLARAEGGE